MKTSASTTTAYKTEQYAKVVELILQGKTLKEVAGITGVSFPVVSDISSLRRHKWLETAIPDQYKQLKLLKQK